MAPTSQPCRINGKLFPSQKAAAKYFGVAPQVISTCLARGNEDNFKRYLGRRRSAAKPITVMGHTFPSRKALAEATGLSASHITMIVNKTATPGMIVTLEERVLVWGMQGAKDFSRKKAKLEKQIDHDLGLDKYKI